LIWNQPWKIIEFCSKLGLQQSKHTPVADAKEATPPLIHPSSFSSSSGTRTPLQRSTQFSNLLTAPTEKDIPQYDPI
jgi:hypothetical protein